MSSFTIKVEGLDKIKGKLDAERLYGPALRHNLGTLAQVALVLAKQRSPSKTGALRSSLDYKVSSAPVPTWSKVTFNPAARSGFRYGYALDTGGKAGGRTYHYRSSGPVGRATFGWLGKIRGQMREAIAGAVSKITQEIEGFWRQ